MMALTSGLFSNNTDTTFSDARRDLEGAVVRDTAGKIRAGVFYNRATPIVTGRADMRLDISDFRAVLDCGGAVFIGNVGTMQSPAFGAAPSANRRIDTLILVQPINPDGATGKPFFEIVQGNASPTPVAPPIPANRADALVIADVEIPASATSLQSAGVIITPRYRFTAMAGGTVPVRNTVELAAWTPVDGSRAFCHADSTVYERVSDAWQAVKTSDTQLAFTASGSAPRAGSFLQVDDHKNVTGALIIERSDWVSNGVSVVARIPDGYYPERSHGIVFAIHGAGSPTLKYGQVESGGSITMHASPSAGQTWSGTAQIGYKAK